MEEFQGPPLPKSVSRVDSDDLLSEQGEWFPRKRLLLLLRCRSTHNPSKDGLNRYRIIWTASPHALTKHLEIPGAWK
ncbi:hypothetical protein T4B_808 [Trichinella pseudospiralis]|uniref:Uncharacterized protein n=1 Tax=Trichinella pseudospiralis TaxID=6337 RepID=A0A0V1H376_TRIPS|nr:hypothetical protein T4B_808 [Trichinella pseudospiralis]